MKITLYDQLIEAKSQHGGKLCLFEKGRQWSFNDVGEEVDHYADRLSKLGLGHGSRMLYIVGREPEALLLFLAASKIGVLFATLDARGEAEKNQKVIDRYKPDLIIFSNAIKSDSYNLPDYQENSDVLLGGTAHVREQVNRYPGRTSIGTDTGLIFFTSGSTGESKGVALSHANVLFAAESICEYLGIASQDRIYNALPLNFDYGFYQLLFPLFSGCACYVAKSFLIPQKNLKEVEQTETTVFPIVPSMARLIKKSGYENALESVRTITNTGEAIHAREVESMSAIFPQARFFSMYGLTECKRTSWLPPGDYLKKPGSVGIAIPGTRIEICDEYNYTLPPGQEGQVVVSGPHIMNEYLDMPEATQKVLFFDPHDKQKKLATGDFGYMDEDGYLYLTGRKDDVFKIDGRKYSCNEQESLLKSFDEIRDACVLVDGETRDITAFIVLAPGGEITEHEIRSRILKHCALTSHVPGTMVMLPEIPVNNNGKHDKKALRAMQIPLSAPEAMAS